MVNDPSDATIVMGEGGFELGERFTLTLSGAGSYALTDAGDPLNQGSLVVDPEAPKPGTQRIFLPVVSR